MRNIIIIKYNYIYIYIYVQLYLHVCLDIRYITPKTYIFHLILLQDYKINENIRNNLHFEHIYGLHDPRVNNLASAAPRFFPPPRNTILRDARCARVIYSGCTHPALPGDYEECGMIQKAHDDVPLGRIRGIAGHTSGPTPQLANATLRIQVP